MAPTAAKTTVQVPWFEMALNDTAMESSIAPAVVTISICDQRAMYNAPTQNTRPKTSRPIGPHMICPTLVVRLIPFGNLLCDRVHLRVPPLKVANDTGGP